MLICALLLKHSDQELRIVLKDSATDGIGELLRWYGMPYDREAPQAQVKEADCNCNTSIGGKAQATEIIHAAFNASRNPPKNTHEEAIEVLLAKLNPSQDGLFSFIRASLELEWKKHIGGSISTDVTLDEYYFRPSYAAKYWLNRYFRLTSRPRSSKKWTEVEQREARKNPGRFKSSNWAELPGDSEVSRLAVIHIRRTAKSDLGRIMNDKNLEHVARSIANANAAARARQEQQISHVMLYGDFYYSEGLHYKALVERVSVERYTGHPVRSKSTRVKFVDKRVLNLNIRSR